MSKGSAPRSFDIDQDTFKNNWERIFGNKNAKQKQEDTDTSGESTHPENQGDELYRVRPIGSE